MTPAQQVSTASVIQQVDAAVKARTENVEGYSVNEHYAFTGAMTKFHPVAEMTVITILPEDSARVTHRLQTVRHIRSRISAILDNENSSISRHREGKWITSANYEMTLKPGGTQQLDGRDCLCTLTQSASRLSYRGNPVGGTRGRLDRSGTGTAQESSVFTGPRRSYVSTRM